ncbi:MAG: hypothetical protein LQ341_007380, partial [Variospora aurantia]
LRYDPSFPDPLSVSVFILVEPTLSNLLEPPISKSSIATPSISKKSAQPPRPRAVEGSTISAMRSLPVCVNVFS